MTYRIIDHTADTGVHVRSETLPGLFEEAGRAMFSLVTDLQRLSGIVCRELAVEGIDRTDLLINWLRELLFIWSGEDALVKDVKILKATDTKLTARVWTQIFDPHQHRIYREIKAVTYHGAEVAKTADGWEVTVIFDV